MKKVILYNPSISSLNKGDEIIFRGVYNELGSFCAEKFIVNISTHLPVSNMFLRYLEDAEYKFVCGSNLLDSRMNARFRQWDVTWKNSLLVGPCILVGVGWRQYQRKVNLYTKLLYRSVLSKDAIHSVRDSYTEKKLNEIGLYNVINTSCPTMWSLTQQHCADIPSTKASKVICTITDYNTDIQKDSKLLDILCKTYKEVYLWLQGYNDYSYIKSLSFENKVKVIPPTVDALDAKLTDDDIEYVGTRLHGGIRALQKKRRAIIIGIDNRALEKQKDFSLNVIRRDDVDKLGDVLHTEFKTDIHVPLDAIKTWKGQFEDCK